MIDKKIIDRKRKEKRELSIKGRREDVVSKENEVDMIGKGKEKCVELVYMWGCWKE